MQSIIMETELRLVTCQHHRRREIGHHLGEDGRFLKLVRCQRCGLLIRELIHHTYDDRADGRDIVDHDERFAGRDQTKLCMNVHNQLDACSIDWSPKL